MKEINKRFINIHNSYGPVLAQQQQQQTLHWPPSLPDFAYYYYPQYETIGSNNFVVADNSLPANMEKSLDPQMYLPLMHNEPLLQTVQTVQNVHNEPLLQTLHHSEPVMQDTAKLQLIDSPILCQPMTPYHPGIPYNSAGAQCVGQPSINVMSLKDRLVNPTINLADLQQLIAPSIQYNNLIQSTSAVKGSPLVYTRKSSSPGSKTRSSLLENFRNNRCPLLSLTDISKHAVEFSLDQHGSRFIQQKLQHSTLEQIKIFYQEVESRLEELMLDVFGNYVVQKLLDHGGTIIQQKLVEKVRMSLLKCTNHQYGCRVVQKIITMFPKATAETIVKDLEPNLAECMKEQHGNHVVQKCVEKVDSSALQIIIQKTTGKICEISCDPYGCRVIQRFLENASPQQRRQILEEVNTNIFNLIQDQYGNYIIQHILDRGTVDEAEKVIQCIGGHVVELSQHKYASNVLEKCVQRTENCHRSAFILELVNSGALDPVIEGQYSNYVLQKMMDTAPADTLNILMITLRQHRASMEKHSYGKNILARLEKYFAENPQ